MAWETKRIKDLFELNPILKKKEIDTEFNVSFVPMECLRCGNIEKRIAKYDDVKSYTPFQNGDLLMAKVTPCFENGNIAIAENLENGIGFGSSEIFVLRSKNIFIKYAFYLSLSNIFHSIGCPSMKGVGGLKRIDPTHLLGSSIQVPPLAEQQRIAAYLDKQTSSIDRRIALLEQKRDKYLVLRKAVINEAVRPKEGWKEVRLKDVGKFTSSGIDKKIKEGEPLVKIINYLDVYDNKTFELRDKEYMVVSAKKETILKNLVQVGDVIFTPSSETIEELGFSATVMENLPNTAYSYHVLRYSTFQIELGFKKYIFNNESLRNRFSQLATGTTRKILSRYDFESIIIALPSKKEQKAIADFLDNRISKIDAIVENLQKQIENLKVLRKCVINESVREKII